MTNKLETLLGFAVKSGKIVFGFDNLCETTKNVKIVVCSPSVNQKVEQKLIKLCEYKGWKLIKTIDLVEDLIHRENCKVVGIVDKNMSAEILKLENIKIVTGE